jgi:hypothetical protein
VLAHAPRQPVPWLIFDVRHCIETGLNSDTPGTSEMNRSMFRADAAEEKIRGVALFRRILGAEQKIAGVAEAANEPSSREKMDRS